jgi:hypothetical protein
VSAGKWDLKITVQYCTAAATSVSSATTTTDSTTTKPTTTTPAATSILTSLSLSTSATTMPAVSQTTGSPALTFPGTTGSSLFGCPTASNCTCSNALCTVQGSITIPSGTTFNLRDGELTVINGNLTLTASSQTAIRIRSALSSILPNMPLFSVRGTVFLGGTLQFSIGSILQRRLSARDTTTTVTVLVAVVLFFFSCLFCFYILLHAKNASAVSGTYSSIQATSTSSCESVSAAPQYTSTTLSITLTATNTCPSAGALSTGAIVGIAVVCLLSVCVCFG